MRKQGYLRHVFVRLVIARTQLHRNRFFYRRHGFPYDGIGKPWAQHKRASLAVSRYFARGAAHIYIYQIKFFKLRRRGLTRYCFRIASEKLHSAGIIPRCQQHPCVPVAVRQPLGAYHFAVNKPGAHAHALVAKRPVRHSCHRRKKYVVFCLQCAYFHLSLPFYYAYAPQDKPRTVYLFVILRLYCISKPHI